MTRGIWNLQLHSLANTIEQSTFVSFKNQDFGNNVLKVRYTTRKETHNVWSKRFLSTFYFFWYPEIPKDNLQTRIQSRAPSRDPNTIIDMTLVCFYFWQNDIEPSDRKRIQMNSRTWNILRMGDQTGYSS